MKTQSIGITALTIVGLACPAFAQTTLGSITLHEEDVPAAAAYCNALQAEAGGDTKTKGEEAAAAAPQSLTNDTGADGAASADAAVSAPVAGDAGATANAELDLSAITIEQCQEAGLLDQ